MFNINRVYERCGMETVIDFVIDAVILCIMALLLTYFFAWAQSKCPAGHTEVNSLYVPTGKCLE